ncbi:MAG: YdcF family protein [Bacteroidia bacterium]|nr:YdcF family protein [Bacteroidia bacterium]
MLKRIILKKILTILIFPISLFGIICIWFIYHLTRNSVTKKIKIIFISAFVFFYLITMQPFASIFINSLENNYACLLDSNKIKNAEYIVILGGGYTDDENMPASSQLGLASLARLIEGMRLKKINPTAQFIFSGGKPYTEKHSEASIYQKTYRSISYDTTNYLLSELPHNTKSEADEVFKLIGKSKIIVVTTASHMPRSMYLFEKMGCKVTAAPCDFSVKDLEYFPSFPNGMSIKQTELAIHEYVAIWCYKLFD